MLQEVYCFIVPSFVGPGVTTEYRKYYYGSYACILCQFVSGYSVLCLLVCPIISSKFL
jgi:hypothetical protein